MDKNKIKDKVDANNKIDILDVINSISSLLLISRGSTLVSETLTVQYTTTLSNTIRRTHVISEIVRSDLRTLSIHEYDYKKWPQ